MPFLEYRWGLFNPRLFQDSAQSSSWYFFAFMPRYTEL